MTTFSLDDVGVRDSLRAELQRQLAPVVEGLVAEAVTEYERRVRHAIGVALITLIESSILIERDQRELVIRVQYQRLP